MDEHTFNGYLAEKQAFEARLAELGGALEEMRLKVDALGQHILEANALLADLKRTR
jgi:hypothetical protein